jgi:hypothetical protein
LPFLRFSRDKRGHETTALVHAFRREGRGRPRILYWFHSPVDVKIGRSPLDEDAIRLIEERHPDLSFDWPKILESRGPDEAEGSPVPRGRRRPEAAVRPHESAGAATGAGGQPPGRQRPDRQGPKGAPRQTSRSRRGGRGKSSPGAQPAVEAPPEESTEPPRTIAAAQAFSPEDLTRLRGRYAALLARIDQEIQDEPRAAQLREMAEALDPDTWVTTEDVRLALEGYEQKYRQLREALGSRPTRPTRKPASTAQAAARGHPPPDDADPA